MNMFLMLGGILAYILASRFALRQLAGRPREIVFASLNITGIYFFLFYTPGPSHDNIRFAIYILIVAFQFLTLILFVEKPGALPWIAFFAPFAALIPLRYIPGDAYAALGRTIGRSWPEAPHLAGISYLAFRCSRLVLEVRNGVVKRPDFLEYINFAFFVPTMKVGPINTYSEFRRGFEKAYQVPVASAALRILVGAVKYQFLGNMANQLAYSNFLLDDHFHPWTDLPVSMVFYYFYLYLNFSGFCDMAIGVAALIGISVPENFDHPFASRNIKDFWNRWHITLSIWMRDVVFSPLSKFLVRSLGPQRANHAIALTIIVVFLLVGIWHGYGLHFAAFGASHALGVVVNHYYTIFLKAKLSREGFKAYNSNPYIQAAAVTVTFCYCAASLFLFANTFSEMKQIFSVMK